MRGLNTRAPRFAGLLVLVLGAVALSAVSGVATAKDHSRDDNGHHGRHHHHHNRHFGMREAGRISSFDAATGKLTIALLDGGTVTGLVTDGTEIKCEGVDDRLDRRDHGERGEAEPGDDHGGQNEPGDDHGGETPPVGSPAGGASCSVASLVPGALVGDAELRFRNGSAVFEEIELGNHS